MQLISNTESTEKEKKEIIKESFSGLNDFKNIEKPKPSNLRKLKTKEAPPKIKNRRPSKRYKKNFYIRNHIIHILFVFVAIGGGYKIYIDHKRNQIELQKVIQERISKYEMENNFEEPQDNLGTSQKKIKSTRFDPQTLPLKSSCTNEFPVRLCSLFSIKKQKGYGYFVESNKLYLHADFKRFRFAHKKYFESNLKIKALIISKLTVDFLKILKSINISSIHFYLTSPVFKKKIVNKKISVNLDKFFELFSPIYDFDFFGKNNPTTISFSDKESFLKAKNSQPTTAPSKGKSFSKKQLYLTLFKVIKLTP